MVIGYAMRVIGEKGECIESSYISRWMYGLEDEVPVDYTLSQVLLHRIDLVGVHRPFNRDLFSYSWQETFECNSRM